MDKYKVIARIGIYQGEPFLSAKATQELFHGKDFLLIRAWLKGNGLDQHIMLELFSTEIAVITPWGVMLQVRSADDGKLGLFGGVKKRNESITECAKRELEEELGIKVNLCNLKFIEEDSHTHTYANGDKALFRCSRFVYELQEVPDEFVFDNESDGVEFVRSNRDDILKAQQDFVQRCVKMYF